VVTAVLVVVLVQHKAVQRLQHLAVLVHKGLMVVEFLELHEQVAVVVVTALLVLLRLQVTELVAKAVMAQMLIQHGQQQLQRV